MIGPFGRSAALGVAFVAISIVATADPLDASWRVSLRGEQEYELKQTIGTADGAVQMVVGVESPGDSDSTQQLELRQVDSEGRLTVPIALTEELGALLVTDPAFARIGHKVVAAASTPNGIVLARFGDELRRVELRRPVEVPNRDTLVAVIVPFPNGELLLAGRSGPRAWIAKANANLEIVWSRTIDEFAATVALHGIAQRDGSFALVGTDVGRGGAHNVWIATFDRDGVLQKRAVTEGMMARMARDGDAYMIVHDRKNGNRWEVWARGYSAALGETWSHRLTTGSDLPSSFEVADGSGNSWAVAYENEGHATITAGAGKTILWTHKEPHLSEEWEQAWNVGSPMVSGDSLVFAYTVLTVDETEEQRQVVRIVKLSTQAD